jgi:transcriptional regulator with GAF, ATPase, and Fis domain
VARKPGRFELAHRGTLFLDEIGDLPLALQAKILRALEEKRFERVGGTQSLHVDVRVVAATNRNLKQRVAERQFREDLFFRLSVFPIQIPPLRERTRDVVILARHFIDRFCRDLNKKALTLSSAALDDLNSYPWPGNVRELQNCIERAVILCDADTIQPRHLNLSFRQPALTASASPWEAINLAGTMAEALRRISTEVERRKLEIALSEAAGNVQRVADVLQISYKTVQQKLKEYGIAQD